MSCEHPMPSLIYHLGITQRTEQPHIEPSSYDKKEVNNSIVCTPDYHGTQAPLPPSTAHHRTMDEPDAENEPGNANWQSGRTVSDVPSDITQKCKAEAGLCEYEQARRQRIQKNFEKLRSLGLSGGIAEAVGVPAPSEKRRSKRKVENCPAEQAPLRRSTRSKPNIDGEGIEASTSHLHEPSAPELDTRQFPAPWLGPELDLQLLTSDTDDNDAWAKPLSTEDEVQGFHAFHCSMISKDLKAVYSLSWYGRLLLAAGKGGICSLYSVPEVAQEDKLDYLACCQLHSSWISDAEMLHPDGLVNSRTGGSSAMPLVLSASNAGEIALWDPAIVDSRDCFSQIVERKDVHNKKGIFSMHVCPGGAASSAAGIHVLSASKDSSVALTTVQGTGIDVVRKWEALHSGVTKAVRWRDTTLAASSGNDRDIHLLDPRTVEPSISIENAHNTVINTLSWASSGTARSQAPGATMAGQENLLLSMSLDPCIRIHDIRRPDKPFAVLCGHTQLRKCGRGVVCGGEGPDNDKMYLYDIKNAEPFACSQDAWESSQGVRMVAATPVRHSVTSVQLNGGGRCVAATGGGGHITVSKSMVG